VEKYVKMLHIDKFTIMPN